MVRVNNCRFKFIFIFYILTKNKMKKNWHIQGRMLDFCGPRDPPDDGVTVVKDMSPDDMGRSSGIARSLLG